MTVHKGAVRSRRAGRSGRAAEWLRAIPAMLLTGLLWTVGGPVSPVRADDATAAQVYEKLGVGDVASDHIVLVDTSLSMSGPRYDDVRAGLGRYFAALAPQDVVTVIPFDTAAVPNPVSTPVGRSPDALLQRLPPAPTGLDTDIGRGIEAALGVLGRPGAPPIATVVLLTDGVHDPAAGSPYPFTEGKGWKSLAERAAGLTKESVTAFAVPLGGEAGGATLLKQVFPAADVLPVGAIGALTDRLDRPRAASQAAKAKQIIAADLTRGVEVRWPADRLAGLRAGDNRMTVTLRATTEHIPLRVTGMALGTDDPTVTARLATPGVSLEPGASAPVEMVVTWSPGTGSWRPSDRRRTAPTITLNGVVDTPWARVLANDIKVSYQPRIGPPSERGRGSTQLGHPDRWVIGTTVVLAAVVVTVILLRRRSRPAVSGLVTAVQAGRVLGTMTLDGRRSQRFGDGLGVSGTGIVSGRRQRGPDGKPLTRLLVEYSPDGAANRARSDACPLGGSVYLNSVRFYWTDGTPPAIPTARVDVPGPADGAWSWAAESAPPAGAAPAGTASAEAAPAGVASAEATPRAESAPAEPASPTESAPPAEPAPLRAAKASPPAEPAPVTPRPPASADAPRPASSGPSGRRRALPPPRSSRTSTEITSYVRPPASEPYAVGPDDRDAVDRS